MVRHTALRPGQWRAQQGLILDEQAVLDEALEAQGLLVVTESGTLAPGREVSRIRLQDILDVVRTRGESGFDRDPSWGREVSVLGRQLDEAVNAVVAEESLADFLDRIAISG